MIKKIILKNKFLKFTILGIRRVYLKLVNKSKFEKYINIDQSKSNKKKVYSLLEPEHSNLGDIALAKAHKKYINDNFPDYQIIDITYYEYINYKKIIKNQITNNDLIVLVGGGSIGNQYLDYEVYRRDVIETFNENYIISFPQSMFFTNDKKGKIELNKSISSYSKCEKLLLLARDKVSYSNMKNSFKNNRVYLTPDIVLSLEMSNPNIKRENKVTLFLRNDVEGIFSNVEKKYLRSLCENYFDEIVFSDTKINRDVPREMADIELNTIFDQFRTSDVIITDRLHGMIFAVITSTPCIVLSNYNHKIKAQYDWIKERENVIFCDEVEEVNSAINKLISLEKQPIYSNDTLYSKFNVIKDYINEYSKEKLV